MITLDNFFNSSPELYDIYLLQEDVGGGEISYEDIDIIADYPNAKSIIISGLKQDTFDYFVKKYGNQFEAISFWKNKSVRDLSSLAELNRVKYINYYHNQMASGLWDMSNNRELVGLSIMDFTKMRSISQIETANSLLCFRLGNEVYDKMEIDSFKPLTKTNITHFTWLGKKLLDGDYKCLAHSKIKVLDINPTSFTMNELAELLSHFPESLEGSITKPYVIGRVVYKDKMTVYYNLCKGKKKCVEGVDDDRLRKYLKEFDQLREEYRAIGNNC